MNQELNDRVSKLEVKVDEHGKKLDSQLEKNETLIELKTLMAIQIEDSKKRDIQMEKFSNTLDNINDNLTNLNINQQQMKQDMGEIANRVSDIERNQEDSKIDPVKLFKQILSYLATAAGSIAIAYILYKLGISNN